MLPSVAALRQTGHEMIRDIEPMPVTPTRHSSTVALLSVVLLIFVTVAAAEGILLALSRLPAVNRVLFPFTGPTLPDAQLQFRGNPNFHEHDDFGFRNPRGIVDAQIVAIGNSHTYEVLASTGPQPYFENADGHPNPSGHNLIASTIARAIAPCHGRGNRAP